MDKLSTSEEDQEKLIDFVLSKLSNTTSVESVYVNRDKGKLPHLRLRFSLANNQTELDLLNSITGANFKLIKTKNKNSKISGKYELNILKLLKEVQDIKPGTEVYLVIADKNRETGTKKNSKELTPAKFKFNGKIIPKGELISRVNEAFKNIKPVSDTKTEVKQFCQYLLDEVNRSNIKNKLAIKLDKQFKDTISQDEINIIAKNFGEILGSLWYMKYDPPSTDVEFPLGEATEVVDYTIHTKKDNSNFLQPISAKSKKGASSGLSGLLSSEKRKIQKSKPRGDSKEYKEFLLKLAEIGQSGGNTKIYKSIIYANIKYYTNAYLNLSTKLNLTSGNPSDVMQDIEEYIQTNYLDKIKKNDSKSLDSVSKQFNKDFKQFYSLCNLERLPDDRMIKQFFSTGSKTLLYFALGKAAVTRMNQDTGLKDYLNLVLKQSGIAQLNIFLTNDELKFVLYNDPRLNSSKGEYIFEYASMFNKPNNKGFSFKLV